MLEVEPSLTRNAAFFRELLEIYSPSGEERAVAERIVAHMTELGYRKAYIDEAGNAVGELGASAEEAEKTIVLLGHIDTVPGFIPVRIEPDGDTIYGRGSVDAKGPFASFVLGAAGLLEQPESLEGKRIVVIGAVEEEAPTSKGARYAQHHYRPDFCIIGEPSSWDRVTIAYKGSLQLGYTLARELKHTAADGPSAAEEGVDFWNKIRAYANRFNEGKKISETLQATLREINSSSDGFLEKVKLRVGMRVPLNFPTEEFKAELRSWAGDGSLEIYGEEQPVRSDKNSSLVRAFYSAIREEGGQPAPKSKTGTSDMNVLGPVWGCPIVAYGPGDSSLDHTPNEHASLAEFERGVKVITGVLARL
ncbi:MAG TPA: [LysW]-lysine hydrolase [Chloroflexia bacterium]|nr:[LysW]-lysine hydrolase [Chloroflexia bacterium]